MEMPPIYRPQGFLLRTASEIPGGDVLLRFHLLAAILSSRKPQAKLILNFMSRDVDRHVDDITHELKLLTDGGWLEVERVNLGKHEHLLINSTPKLRALVVEFKREEQDRIDAWKARR